MSRARAVLSTSSPTTSMQATTSRSRGGQARQRSVDPVAGDQLGLGSLDRYGGGRVGRRVCVAT